MSFELLQKQGLSLERLESFCKIIDSGGLAAAAGENAHHVTKLSRRVSDLEKYFGVELVTRTGRGLAATEAGKELYRIVRHDLRLLDDFRAKCAGLPAVLRIAAGNSMVHWAIAPYLGELTTRLPGFALHLRALRTFERVPAVRNHECDLAIVREEAITGQMKGRHLLTIHHRLVLHRQLVERARTIEADRLLQRLPLVLPSEGDLLLTLDKALAQKRIKLNVVSRVPTFTMAARVVHTGRFASILPHIAARDFPEKDFAVLPVPLLRGYQQRLSICWNPAYANVSPVVTAALPVLLEVLGRRVRPDR